MVHFDDANGLVRVGTGNIVGFHTFLTWQDPDVVLAFKCAAVSTGLGADGDWVVCIPERCSGVFDADAKLVGAELLDCSSRVCNPVDCPHERRGRHHHLDALRPPAASTSGCSDNKMGVNARRRWHSARWRC